MDTLAVQLCTSSLPTRTRDFHPLERAHGAQTTKRGAERIHSSFLYTYKYISVLFNLLDIDTGLVAVEIESVQSGLHGNGVCKHLAADIGFKGLDCG